MTFTKANNLVVRSLSGIVFVAIIVGSIFINRVLFSCVFFLTTILTMVEFYRIVAGRISMGIKYIPAVITGSVLFISSSLVSLGIIKPILLVINIPIMFLVLVMELYYRAPKPLINVAFLITGIVYIALPFSLLNFFFVPEFQFYNSNNEVMLGYFIILWAYDSFAYLIGSSLGKHRLFERISPKKSWEGTIGGFICGLAVAWIISLFMNKLTLENWLIVAVIIMFFGTFGDLVESLFKRSLDIKDSGSFMPGHGGLLDRFDAMLLSAPLVFVYLVLIVN